MKKERKQRKEVKRKTKIFTHTFLKLQVLLAFLSENEIIHVATTYTKNTVCAFKHISVRDAGIPKSVLCYGLQ